MNPFEPDPLAPDPLAPDPFENADVQHLKLFIYLLPVVGVVPALWALYWRQGTRTERNLSRLVLTLAAGWLLSYALLGWGAQANEGMTIPLLMTSSLLTSGYFLVNIGLMWRLWQRRLQRERRQDALGSTPKARN